MDLKHLKLHKVEHVDAPAPKKPLHRMTLGPPVWKARKLVRTFVEKPLTKPELAKAMAAVRAERDRRLQATDWSQIVADIPEKRRAAFAAYRQALRDLPAKTPDPRTPAWPKLPA